jgi:hypothetical protein
MNGRTLEGTFISKFEKPAADVVGHWLVTRR